MSYYGSWKIDDLLTFTVNTHNPETGAASDAASVPSYRVYEDETATAILTGSMALLDSTNTEGFYSEQITLSAANGFEKGKSYHIYISATVNSVTGTISHNFQVEAEVDANSTANPPLSAAQVNAEVDTALADIGLDHLLAAAVAGADVTDNSVIAKLVSASATADWDDFVNTDDSLQAIRDRGDANWATGTSPIADAVWDEVLESNGPTNAQTARELFRIICAVLLGKTAGSNDWSARDVGDTKTRLSATLDSQGNRTTINTLDGS